MPLNPSVVFGHSTKEVVIVVARKAAGAALLLVILLCLSALVGCGGGTNEKAADVETHTVVDMRGVEVEVPDDISRVIDMSDGFTSSVMYSFGVADKVVGLGSDCLKDMDEYTFPTDDGTEIVYENGMRPVAYLYPEIRELPAVAKYEEAVNLETIADLDPDLIIIRKGFGSMCTMEYGTEEDIQKSIKQIEDLGFPTIVILGPSSYEDATIDTMYEEIEVLGEAFNKQEEAESLNEYLKDTMETIKEKVASVPETDRPRVLFFGLSPNARDSGGAGDVLGTDTIESYYLSDIVNAENAYAEAGGWKIMNTEQVITLNPDAIVLPTDWGYHPAEELYSAPYYSNLRELEAVKNRRVFAMPYIPYNTAKALEFPIEVMVTAKAAHPELIDDAELRGWVIDFYKNVYGASDEDAEGCRSSQFMDWSAAESG